MKSTLIVGTIGTGKTTKLNDVLKNYIGNADINYYGNGETYTGEPLNEFTDFTKLPTDKSSIAVIEEISRYENFSIPLDIPVFATIQASTVDDAKKRLNCNNIKVNFEQVIMLGTENGIRTLTLSKW